MDNTAAADANTAAVSRAGGVVEPARRYLAHSLAQICHFSLPFDTILSAVSCCSLQGGQRDSNSLESGHTQKDFTKYELRGNISFAYFLRKGVT